MSEADTIREALAAKLHDVYQAEAKRQGDVRHHDDYADLSEPIKDYDRALADFILERDAALERRAEQAEREREEWRQGKARAMAKLEQAEAALRTRETRIKAEWYRHGLHDTAGYTDREVETMLRGFGIAMFAALAATTPGEPHKCRTGCEGDCDGV